MSAVEVIFKLLYSEESPWDFKWMRTFPSSTYSQLFGNSKVLNFAVAIKLFRLITLGWKWKVALITLNDWQNDRRYDDKYKGTLLPGGADILW